MASKADYGLDAPGLVRGFLAGGGTLTALGLAAATLAPALADWAPALLWPGLGFLASGLLMLGYSYAGKFRARDALLDGLGLRGDERVLDLGCGRGLLLIGAARRLPRGGEAVGVDLWSLRDLSGNRRDATLANASHEGVRDRVTVVDGDMRSLPFPDGAFDVVVASMSIHNIPDAAGRRQAVLEAARVLRPGGRVALLDFARTGEYAATLAEAGFAGVRRRLSPWCFPPSRIVYGERPRRADQMTF